MANARSSAYQPTGDDSTDNNARVPQDRPRTLRIETLARSGPNSQRHHECESGRHSAHHIEPQSDPGPVTPLGPLSSLERRPTGTGLTLNSYYDPIRGENVLCSFVSRLSARVMVSLLSSLSCVQLPCPMDPPLLPKLLALSAIPLLRLRYRRKQYMYHTSYHVTSSHHVHFFVQV